MQSKTDALVANIPLKKETASLTLPWTMESPLHSWKQNEGKWDCAGYLSLFLLCFSVQYVAALGSVPDGVLSLYETLTSRTTAKSQVKIALHSLHPDLIAVPPS